MASSSTIVGRLMVAFLFVGIAQGSFINVKNQCPYPVTTCAQSESGPVSQYQIGARGSQKLDFGPANRWPSGTIWASVGGRCAAPGNPSAAADRNMANLAEFHLPGSGNDFYDLSNVDAYTIPLMINPTNIAGGRPRQGFQCGTPSCTISNIRGFCTGGNQLVQHPSGSLTCRNVDGPGNVATPKTRRFKDACPTSYSYSKDDATSTYACSSGTDYEVVFCPENHIESAV
jgi:hypothetical protein